jgi:hypothetical protein
MADSGGAQNGDDLARPDESRDSPTLRPTSVVMKGDQWPRLTRVRGHSIFIEL